MCKMGVRIGELKMVDIVMWNWIIVVSLTVTIAVCLLGEYKNV